MENTKKIIRLMKINCLLYLCLSFILFIDYLIDNKIIDLILSILFAIISSIEFRMYIKVRDNNDT